MAGYIAQSLLGNAVKGEFNISRQPTEVGHDITPAQAGRFLFQGLQRLDHLACSKPQRNDGNDQNRNQD